MFTNSLQVIILTNRTIDIFLRQKEEYVK